MTDDPDAAGWPDGLGEEGAIAIGCKVADMADRVRTMNAACSGVEAEWAFTMDGIRFLVRVSVLPEQGIAICGEPHGPG